MNVFAILIHLGTIMTMPCTFKDKNGCLSKVYISWVDYFGLLNAKKP